MSPVVQRDSKFVAICLFVWVHGRSRRLDPSLSAKVPGTV
jgi:hypothetical protein